MSDTVIVRKRDGQFQSLKINLTEESVYYIPSSQNRKTGRMPSQFIGSSREESEATCRTCPLWKENTCYAQDGSPQLGHGALLRVVRRGEDRTLETALENRRVNAKYARFGSIGDPGSIAPDVYQKHEQMCRDEGLGVLSYTHQWFLEHAQHLKGHALASCDNMKDVQDATTQGWRTAIHVDANAAVFNGKTIEEAPQGTIKREPIRGADGRFKSNSIKYFLCPAQREGSKATCNTCGLCDGTKETKYNTIVFIEHGQQLKFKKQRDAKAKAE